MGKPYKLKDHFYTKAKKEGFRARSAFKMEEIARRVGLLKKGGRVLDIGAAPGGFLQVIAQAVGPTGAAIGVDIVPMKPFPYPQVKTAALDVLADDFQDKLKELDGGVYDAVISDLAPKTTGIRSTDEARSHRLATIALEVAWTRGKPASGFVAKIFMGADFEEFRDAVRERYEDVKIIRPEATRGASIEVYVVGTRKRPELKPAAP